MKRLWIDFKCILAALLLTLLLCIIAAAAIYFTPVSESLMRPLGTIILAIGVFAAGAMSGRVSGKYGIFPGLRIGLYSMILMIIATLVLLPPPIEGKHILNALMITLPAGAAGGIFGVMAAKKAGK